MGFKSDYSLLKQWGQRRSIRSEYQTVENNENTARRAFWCVFPSAPIKKKNNHFHIWYMNHTTLTRIKNLLSIFQASPSEPKANEFLFWTFLYVHFYNATENNERFVIDINGFHTSFHYVVSFIHSFDFRSTAIVFGLFGSMGTNFVITSSLLVCDL